ncbi:sigma-54-dependent Fis family transcriptional regulator, partial [Candidatus Poribacteria bacterium]|nr:sigma-54-dependent Fis family transcriptional regulator [Candidatus Poribacteria bacterium]
MLLGESAAMQTVHTVIDQLSNNSKIPVLITGETGVGKGLVAQAIHFGGSRASKPYVPVNCGATPLTLWESNFFGHVQGAFTGADADHKGYFETADSGTLFLDEIGEMPIESQVKLLQVLDDNVITPVGATVGKTADIRVIAATNADLQAKVEAGLFRSDLYNRLDGVEIWIPPLRERTEDIPLITEFYLSQFAAQMRVLTPSLTPEATAALETYPFPGNVRELIHIIEHAVIVSDGEAIQPKHLHFRSSHIGVSSSPATQIDESSPLNALDSVPQDMSEAPFLPLNEALVRYERQYLYQV